MSPRRAAATARAWLARFSAPGLTVALVMFAAALGPALTPRPALFQGAGTGAAALTGYGLGVLGAWVLRRCGLSPDWSPATRRRGWWVLAAAAAVVVPGSLVLSHVWQDRLRELMGMAPQEGGQSVAILGIALVLALLVLLAGRGLRRVTRRLRRLLGRWVPVPVARLVAVVVVAIGTFWLVDGTLGAYVRSTLNTVYAALDGGTAPGVVAPGQPERSGSPASPVTWDTLGLQGRSFVAGGRSVEGLADVVAATGAEVEVREPVRVYAGLGSADGFEAQARLVVDELDRTGAWDRSALLVVAATGTGWIDPGMSDAFESVWGGDTAIASMQYSYLPSWISFVGDRSTPPAAGRALFEAVRERWLELPTAQRPALYVAGISLGSFGSQGSFASLQDVSERVDGALWVGTPGFTPLWLELTAARDPGSREVQPVLDGGAQVRWGQPVGTGPGLDLADLGEPWEHPRVVYLQHPSDGVMWWSPSLLFSQPDWLREPRGHDVLPEVRWVPVATFWALTIDMFVAGDVPNGFGHNYLSEYVDGFAAIAAPPGWDEDATRALRDIVLADDPTRAAGADG